MNRSWIRAERDGSVPQAYESKGIKSCNEACAGNAATLGIGGGDQKEHSTKQRPLDFELRVGWLAPVLPLQLWPRLAMEVTCAMPF